MNALVPQSPAERLARLIEVLCKAVAARGGRSAIRVELPYMVLPGPLVVLIWNRLRRIGLCLDALLTRIRAGTLRPRRAPNRPPPAPPLSPAPAPPPPPRRPPPPPHPLMKGAGWLFRLVPEARVGNSLLRHLMSEPDMAALLAEHEPLRRAIRPLCRILNIPPPPLPAKSRPKPPPPEPPPSAPAPVLQPKRAAPAAPASGYIIQEVPQRWRLNPFPPGSRRRGGRGPPVPA